MARQKALRKTESIPLIYNICEEISGKSSRKTPQYNEYFKKFKSPKKQVYQKGCTHKHTKKKNQNNDFRGEITPKSEKLLTNKKQIDI